MNVHAQLEAQSLSDVDFGTPFIAKIGKTAECCLKAFWTTDTKKQEPFVVVIWPAALEGFNGKPGLLFLDAIRISQIAVLPSAVLLPSSKIDDLDFEDNRLPGSLIAQEDSTIHLCFQGQRQTRAFVNVASGEASDDAPKGLVIKSWSIMLPDLPEHSPLLIK